MDVLLNDTPLFRILLCRFVLLEHKGEVECCDLNLIKEFYKLSDNKLLYKLMEIELEIIKIKIMELNLNRMPVLKQLLTYYVKKYWGLYGNFTDENLMGVYNGLKNQNELDLLFSVEYEKHTGIEDILKNLPS